MFVKSDCYYAIMVWMFDKSYESMEKIHYKALKIVFNHDAYYDDILTVITKYLFTKNT